MQGGDESRRGVPDHKIRTTGVKDLAKVVEGHSPGVEAGRAFVEKTVQAQRARIEAPQAAAVEFHDAAGRFDVGPDVVALGEPERAVGAPTNRIDVLVSVPGAKAAQHHPALFEGA